MFYRLGKGPLQEEQIQMTTTVGRGQRTSTTRDRSMFATVAQISRLRWLHLWLRLPLCSRTTRPTLRSWSMALPHFGSLRGNRGGGTVREDPMPPSFTIRLVTGMNLFGVEHGCILQQAIHLTFSCLLIPNLPSMLVRFGVVQIMEF